MSSCSIKDQLLWDIYGYFHIVQNKAEQLWNRLKPGIIKYILFESVLINTQNALTTTCKTYGTCAQTHLQAWVFSLLPQEWLMNRMINEHSITTCPQLYSVIAWDFHPCKIKQKKFQHGLFFTINNSFWHIGEEVKLGIPQEHSLQRRMTRNNEEILPQTLHPAEWRQVNKEKKLRSCWIFHLSREITFLFIFNKYLLQSYIKNNL